MTDAKALIEIATDVVAVGETLRGNVTGTAAPDAPIFVEILWRTQFASIVGGSFEGEEKLLAAQEIDATGANAGRFEFQIPVAGPMSYEGKTFSIEWFLRIAGQPAGEKGFTVTAQLRRPEPS